MRVLLLVITLCFLGMPVQAAETVVLLHGIAKTSNSMKPVEAALRKAGYDVLSITYPSTKKNVRALAAGLREKPLNSAFWDNAEIVHFVTHSMGGLVVQRYLDLYRQDIPAGKLGRVVMMGPPNGGSEVADLLQNISLYRWYYGPAGQDLTTRTRKAAAVTPYYELGIIAGTKEWPYIVSAFVVPGPGDGRVSVEKTKMPGMTDHMTVPATHTFIMDRSDVHRQILSFLKDGQFTRK